MCVCVNRWRYDPSVGKSSSILPLLKKQWETKRMKESKTGFLSSGSHQSHLIKTWLKFFGWLPAPIYSRRHTLLRHTVSPCLSLWLVTAVACLLGYTLLISCHRERSCSNTGYNLKSHFWTAEDPRVSLSAVCCVGREICGNRKTAQAVDEKEKWKIWKNQKAANQVLATFSVLI